ncbi:hypothetical protein ACFQ7J_02195 [Streptomyces sp. NPDC056501]|uniref:hypothetical protein n=1 Tax=Streptomyces sp. NPDC056501 TaxID=3345841 RepID=UPI0036C4590A
MQYPDDVLREELERRAYESEDDCVAGLNLIAESVEKHIEPELTQDPAEVLVAVEGWAALASYVVARTYAPASPMRFPGWVRGVGIALRRIARLLTVPLNLVARALGCPTYTVGVAFPWGVSVSLDWNTH